MKRPVGVTIIGILGVIGAVIGILASLTLLGVGSLGAVAGADIGIGVIILGVIYLVFSVFMLFFAISFLALKPWAWWGYFLILVLNIVVGIISMIVNGFSSSALISIIIYVLLALYMNTGGVKQAFFGVR